MFGALAKLAVTRDPAALCRVVADAITTDSIIGAGVLAAIEANSATVRERFITLAGFDEERAAMVRELPFLWLPAGEREVGLVMSEGPNLGEWGIHDISQLRAGILRGASRGDAYGAAVAKQTKPKLRVVK
jgi:hypothetical protein